MRNKLRVFVALGALSGLLLAGTAVAARPHVGPPWLTTNAGTKTANLTLVGEYKTTAGGFNFDGYANGGMSVTMPVGWTVNVVCSNSPKANVNHSCAVVKKKTGTKPAFDGASSKKPKAGLAPGKSSTFTFKPTTPGTYYIACLVPGHVDAGMWETFIVVSSGTPSVTYKK